MGATINVNNRTVVHKDSGGISTAFPDVCKTPAGPAVVPIPYPNIASSSDMAKGSKKVKMDGNPIMLKGSNFSTSTGDEAGTAGGGVVSGKIKGKAEFVSYSFDVKVEGKNVPRLGDSMIQNCGSPGNTPPIPEVQAPLLVVSSEDKKKEKEEKGKCPYCNKDKHKFSKKPGWAIGNSSQLRTNMYSNEKHKAHKWWTGSRALQAHHLICSEAMDSDLWKNYCKEFGYDINNKNNGVMLPYLMELACQIYAPLHRGNHSKGKAGPNLSYPKKIKQRLSGFEAGIERGKFCDTGGPDKLIHKLNLVSRSILVQIDLGKYTITKDGKDYKKGGGLWWCQVN